MNYHICNYLITIRHDLEAITSILYQTFEITPFKRNYDAAFGQISAVLHRYGIIENPSKRKQRNHKIPTISNLKLLMIGLLQVQLMISYNLEDSD
jgi:hypothetical protein